MRLIPSGIVGVTTSATAWLRAGMLWFGLCPSVGHAAPSAVLAEDISPQPLATALKALVRQTSLQLVYVSAVAEGKRSPGARAGSSAPDALGQLLQGTGIRSERLNDRTVRLIAAPALAIADATAAARPAARHVPLALEGVIVSATRREQTLQLVPISAVVVTDREMVAYRLDTVADFGAITPGVEYDFSSQYGSGFYTNFAIRGIASDKGDSTTAVYIDDTAIETPHTSFKNPYPSTFDLARVEVLRGPQGMLFGRSAEGGAIRFITKEPSTRQSDQIYTSGIASTERGGVSVDGGVAAGGPLLPGILGARISAWYRHEGGYVDRVNPFSGATVDANSNRSERRAVRAALAYEPNDALRVLPMFSYQMTHVADAPVFYEYLSDPGAGRLQNGRLLRQPADDRLVVGALKVEGRLPAASITSVTSYVDRHATAVVDATNEVGAQVFGGYGNPLGPAFPVSYYNAITNNLATRQAMSSEELRIASPDSSTPLTWLAGIYYSKSRQNDAHYLYTVQLPVDPAQYTNDDVDHEELAAFGQATLELFERWKAGFGLRLGRLRIDSFRRSGGYADPDGTRRSFDVTRGRVPPTPRFDVSYAPDGEHFYYGSVARGYRIGAEHSSSKLPCSSSDVPSFGPDTVWSFELGAKTQFLDDRIRVNASVFHLRWTNLQEHVLVVCGNFYTVNAGAAANDGFDLDAETAITDHFHVKLALGYGNVHYTKTIEGPDGSAVADRGTVVGGLPAVPSPWSGTLTGAYEWPVGRETGAYVRAQFAVHSHNPGPFTELNPKSPVYDPRNGADPATALLNVHAGLTRGGWTVEAYVDNALDAHPALQRNGDIPGTALTYAYTFRPRTCGISASLRR